MPTWLVFAHASNHSDYRHTSRVIDWIVRNSTITNVIIYIAMFGPTRHSDAILLRIARGNAEVIARSPVTPMTAIAVLNTFTDMLADVDAFCGTFHGSGWCIGPWKHTKECFMTTRDMIRATVAKLSIPLVCFDSCYMGNLSCLYELPQCVRYVVASPAFHPYVSLMRQETFLQLPAAAGKDYATSLAREWTRRAWSRARYSCLLVFEMSRMAPLIETLKRDWSRLRFGSWSRIDKEDANLSDLWSAAAAAPAVRRAIADFVVDDGVRTRCKKIHGPSVERRLPRKWQQLFVQTRFYRDVLSRHWQ